MYVMYIRRVYGRAFSRSSSLSDGFNKPIYLANNSIKIPRPPTHVRLCTLGLLFERRFVPSSPRVERLALEIRCTPSFPFGLFSHHSNKDNSLQDYPSFAGETIGTRIDRDNSLIMPPSFVRQLRNNTAQSDGTTVKLGAHILAALRLALGIGRLSE